MTELVRQFLSSQLSAQDSTARCGVGRGNQQRHQQEQQLGRGAEARAIVVIRRSSVRSGRGLRGLLEDYGFGAVEEDAIFYVPADGAGENDFFEVATFLDKVVDGVAVIDADDILLDDGAVVEDLGDVVSGGADDFDSALEGLMVGLGADEGGKEGVVNVDDVLRAESSDEFGGENLHVAGEDGDGTFVLAEEGELAALGLGFVVFGDGEEKERDAIEVGDALIVGMIGDDEGDVAAELAALMAVKEVLQAMVVLGDEDGEARTLGGEGETPIHLEVAGDGGEVGGEVGERECEVGDVELDAGEEEAGGLVAVLVIGENVAVVFEDEVGDGGDDAFGVGTGDEKDGGVVHGFIRKAYHRGAEFSRQNLKTRLPERTRRQAFFGMLRFNGLTRSCRQSG